MRDIEFSAETWSKAGSVMDEVAGRISPALDAVAASATNSDKVGASKGVSTFDAAVATLLEGLRAVMNEVGTGIGEGVVAEAELLRSTGRAYASAEEENVVCAQNFGGGNDGFQYSQST